MAGVTVSQMQLARMAIDHADHEMQLEIRRGRIREAAQEAAAFGAIRSHHAGAFAPIAADLLHHLQ